MDYKKLKLCRGVNDADLLYLVAVDEKNKHLVANTADARFPVLKLRDVSWADGITPVKFRTKAELIKAIRENGEFIELYEEEMKIMAKILKDMNLSYKQLANLNAWMNSDCKVLPELIDMYEDGEDSDELNDLANEVDQVFNDLLIDYLIYNLVARENEPLALAYEERLIHESDHKRYIGYFDIGSNDNRGTVYSYINLNEFEWSYIEIYNSLSGNNVPEAGEYAMKHYCDYTEYLLKYLMEKYAN